VNVLSLFDGVSCGQLALVKAGIPFNKYYASEINKNSIAITQKNYPSTIQLGNAEEIDYSIFNDEIKLLLGGSPCEDLSITQSKIRTNLEGTKSKLFYCYYDALTKLNPDYFFFENVASMTEESKETITSYLGVQPLKINSNLFSAQDRERYYWTNIVTEEELQLPNKNIILKDILEKNVNEKYFLKNITFDYLGEDKKVCAKVNSWNTHDISKRVYNPNFKCATLTSINGGYQEKKVWDNGRVRKLTPLEYERLQTLPDNYTYIKGMNDNARRSVCGDGWTVDVVAHIFSYLPIYTTENKEIEYEANFVA
jgi:DNA-cytosine methyltransferase